MSDVAEMLRKTLQSHKELYEQTQELLQSILALRDLIGSLREENKDLRKRLKLMERA